MTTDLIAIEIVPAQVFQQGGLDPLLAAIQEKINEFVGDASTEAGRKDIKSFAYEIARSKTYIDKAGKSLVDDQKASLKVIDNELKRARDWCDKKKSEALQPVTDWQAEEDKKVARLLRVTIPDEAISDNVQHDREVAKKLDLERRETAMAEKEQAAQAKQDEEDRLEHEARIKDEAAKEAIRAADQKIKAAEEKTEATKKAKKLADAQAICDAAKARERAEADKIAAVERAKKEAAEKVSADEKARADKLAKDKAEADKKAANKSHRASVNNKILAGLKSVGIDGETGKKLIGEIARGNIAFLRIEY